MPITESVVSWELELINDNLALEFVEELLLNFEVNPAFQPFIDLVLAKGEFIRDRVTVAINDNDGETAELFVFLWLYTYSGSRDCKSLCIKMSKKLVDM